MAVLQVLFLGQSRVDALDAELRRAGYEPSFRCVDQCSDLSAALESTWDIAICDSVAGECGAIQTLRTIQERGIDLPVIVISGNISDSEILAALWAGAADHLTKGDLKRLNAAVARELRSVTMRRERVRLEEQIRQSQKMEAVGRLAAGVAHDFNNLLTIVTGYSDLLLAQGNLSDLQRTGLEEIRRAADRGGALTNQLLSFSRRRPLETRRISLNDLLLRMERMLRRLIGEDINLITLPSASPDTVECDPGRLEQVILNLAVNARDAIALEKQRRGGTLTIETSTVTVGKRPLSGHLSVPPGRYVSLSVTDTGIGMDEETRKHLFEPFFTTKAPGSGTGLGLATAYGTVHQMGGAIGITSEPGHGTTVQMYLPLAKDKGRPAKSKTSPKAMPARGETILVVEDDARVRKLIVGVLTAHGYTVLEATRGEEAIRCAKELKGKLDLALVDVVMPEMSGPEVVQRITPLFPEMRVLYVSGYGDEAIVHHRIPETGAAFLQKPFLPDALARKVREVLDPRGETAT
jgi:two-component system cell cycle sensor histidine kinase/response regulator CckA